MKLSLRTRSRDRDYVFVGRRQVDPWWNRGDFGKLFSSERPAVAVRRRGKEWQALLTGVPSDRKDTHNTVIRFTILAESEAGDKASDAESVVRAVAEWLRGCREGQIEGAYITGVLRRRFPEDEVEQWFSGASPHGEEAPDPKVAEKIERVLKECFDGCPADDEIEAAGTSPERWIGGLHNSNSQGRFVRVMSGLLRADRALEGIALVAADFRERRDLLEEVATLKEFASGCLVVLGNDDEEVEPLVPKVSRAAVPPSAQGNSERRAFRGNWWLAAVLLVVIALAVWLGRVDR